MTTEICKDLVKLHNKKHRARHTSVCVVVKASFYIYIYIKRTCAYKGWTGKNYHRSSDMSRERTVHHFRAHGPPQQVLQMDIRAFIHTCTM